MTLVYKGYVADPIDRQACATLRLYKLRWLCGYVTYIATGLAAGATILFLLNVGSDPQPETRAGDTRGVASITATMLVVYPAYRIGTKAQRATRFFIDKWFNSFVDKDWIVKVPDLVEGAWARAKNAYETRNGTTVHQHVEAATLYAMSTDGDCKVAIELIGSDAASAKDKVEASTWLEDQTLRALEEQVRDRAWLYGASK